jgi:hypothetical protein
MSETTEVACRLIGPDLAERKALIAAKLLDQIEGVDELLDGFELHWRIGDPWADRVLEFVRLERLCCPFIRFEVIAEPNDGPVTLRLLGSDEIKRFIVTELLSAGERLPTITPRYSAGGRGAPG